jgi:hypothetical protein
VKTTAAPIVRAAAGPGPVNATDATEPPPGRATTPAQKRNVIEQIYLAWLRRPQMRLGELLTVATWDGGPLLFCAEDDDLAVLAELAPGLDPEADPTPSERTIPLPLGGQPRAA